MRIALLVATALPILLLTACGDEAKKSTVEVTLSEWQVAADPDSVPEGDVTFNVDNEGDETHELLVVRTDFDPAELPTKDNGSVDEGADGIDVVGETDDIDSGDDDSRIFELDAGNYVLMCNLVEDGESHYQMGMHTSFEVTAAD